ncbi:MAG: Gfo/Idh/MocA family oxidoreductase [Planctomycetota bacterium]
MRIYLIGTGHIAHRHAAATAELDFKTELFAADPSEAARSAFSEAYPDASLFADAQAMLEASPARDDDVVVVAAPPWLHHGLTLQALASGRHVLCEKPLAMDADEARSMLAAARAAGRRLGCCSNRMLSLPATQAAADRVAGGDLGRVYHATWIARRPRRRTGVEYQPQTRWFLDRSRSGGGVLMDWGPYDFTTLHRVLQPEAMTVRGAWTARPRTAADPADVVNDVEQHVGALLHYELSDSQTLDVSYERSACNHGAARELAEIEGRAGAIAWTWVPGKEGSDTLRVSTDDGGELVETVDPMGKAELNPAFVPLIAFARLIRGDASPMALVDESAVFNFLCLQAVYQAADSGQPVRVARGDL